MPKRILLRSILLLTGLLVGLLLAETAVRYYLPSNSTSGGIPMSHVPVGKREDFEPDDECGYLPRIDGSQYGPEGCLRNSYALTKVPGNHRVLFVGDSVTHRARIINKLRQKYGESSYEYWNAGVESFNTAQELVLYRRCNFRIKPDLVVLTLHNNDFMQTPLVYQRDGKLQLLTPLHDRHHINGWLFQNSYLYRFYVGRNWRSDQEEKSARVRQDLSQLKQLVEAGGGQFRVILLPLMRSEKLWDLGERWSREQSLSILKDLHIAYFDLLPVLEAQASQGKPLEETVGDYWHPNQAVADQFGEALYHQGVLAR